MNQNFLQQWDKLELAATDPSLKDLQSLFENDTERAEYFSFEVADIFVDFSKNWLNSSVLRQLIDLSKNAKLQDKIKALFDGKNINISENKPATHTAQRKTLASKQVLQDQKKMFVVAENFTSGQWLTAFGKKVNAVVNIGIGGSYLGPKLAVQALSELQTSNDIKVFFYPCVDDASLKSMLNSIDMTRTLFCISSKSMGTIETIRNTQTIVKLLQEMDSYNPQAHNQSFVAATANIEKAQYLKIPNTHIMPFDNATGGRFSVWSSIGFPVLMAIGEKKFKQFLAGAEKIDQHFLNTKLEKNIPVIMALVSIWYRNFMDLSAYSVIPYDVRLKNLPAWLQQLMMESNGKMRDVNGNSMQASTSPWLFGEHGQLSQHAFFQAFHQGKDILPIDFIGVLAHKSDSQDFLLINMLAQSAALMHGNDDGDKQCYCPGNRPSTTYLLKEMTASSLGQLLALYEHMVFVQSVIWNINCFDQPGVELGKKVARNITKHMKQGSLKGMNFDKSTEQLLSRIFKEY
ncbi:MAG: glucose-6-phosphate isomerase [Alcanivoracaceae bacterium]|nr:glucose-6-phosphate isomerase [Alcanivoracaceae bacterium]